MPISSQRSLRNGLAAGELEDGIRRQAAADWPGAAIAQPDGEIGVADLGQAGIRILIGLDGLAEDLVVVKHEAGVTVRSVQRVMHSIPEWRNLQVDVMIAGVGLGDELVDGRQPAGH